MIRPLQDPIPDRQHPNRDHKAVRQLSPVSRHLGVWIRTLRYKHRCSDFARDKATHGAFWCRSTCEHACFPVIKVAKIADFTGLLMQHPEPN